MSPQARSTTRSSTGQRAAGIKDGEPFLEVRQGTIQVGRTAYKPLRACVVDAGRLSHASQIHRPHCSNRIEGRQKLLFEIDRNLRLPRNIGPDAFGYKARFTIHAWTSGGKTDTKVWV